MWKEVVVAHFEILSQYSLADRLKLNRFVFYATQSFNFRIHKSPGVGIATGYGLDGRGVGVRFPIGSSILLCRVQTGSGAHPASYPVGIVGSFPGGKVAGA
jgi:hypothetical protein